MKALLVGLVAMAACVDTEVPELGEKQQAMRRQPGEVITVEGCGPGSIPFGDGDDLTCIPNPFPSWPVYEGPPLRDPPPRGGPGGLPPDEGGGGGGPVVPVVRMDPEPDRYKDRHSCEDWCAWNMRQCEKECWHRYPNPVRDFWDRTVCFNTCKISPDPNHGLEACRADCQLRFPERPMTTVAP